ncbi:MAG: hypothetical protein JRF42_17255, partial [Deltaproteobacteria bacterium]|nr:hypothetical protein [Deltaproteobacteria bacterium]
AHIAGTAGAKPDEVYPPISIAPLVDGESLRGIEYSMPIASAQVKSALLLSGLYASGRTAIEEPVLSRDHTERMMLALGVPLQTAGASVVLGLGPGLGALRMARPRRPLERGVPAAGRRDDPRQPGQRRGRVRQSDPDRSLRLAAFTRREHLCAAERPRRR